MTLKKLLIFGLCISLFACSSESTDTPDEPTNDSTLLKKTIETYDDEVITTNYTYDGNKLISVISDDGYKFEYIYENGILVRVNSYVDGELDGYTTISYNQNEKIANYILHIINDITEKYVFTFNSDNTVTESRYIGDLNSQTNFQNTTTYSYTGENITNLTNTGYELSYQYDNKNGIYKNIHAIEVLNLLSIDFGALNGNTNNPTSIIDNNNGNIASETFGYTYNESDYPKTANYTSKYKGVTDDTSTIQFFYE
ncbi:hypothetical protein Q4Q34_16420 [Flavivirga abyssicola]|uniref:hypothetical protein n=1 Tax=Flavivirga abyssicola TaxID=3063533 RepID=UPI0026DEEC60|nr:hypothetical protein [Flavivirga sp. MEBiC07777]WVK12802.1 hypothetical protein Q4Q34_16420 [Flavivirga sp. MEBiC07777]